MEKRQCVSVTDPDEYGFGIKAMKRIKVCGACGNTEAANRYICGKCGSRLPSRTLFQIYQQKHRTCEICDTVLASYMRFCPHCGKQVE